MNEILDVIQNGNIVTIKNPFFGDPNIVYDDLLNDFRFKCRGLNQNKNFNKLKLTLEPFNISINRIMVKMDKPIYFINRTRTQFIATSINNEVIWHKYEGPLLGGGQNYIYIYGKKFKLSHWFNLTYYERLNLINILS